MDGGFIADSTRKYEAASEKVKKQKNSTSVDISCQLLDSRNSQEQ